MLDRDKLLIKIGKNRSGESSGQIDMEVAVQLVENLCDYDFRELLKTLDSARNSCLNTQKRASNLNWLKDQTVTHPSSEFYTRNSNMSYRQQHHNMMKEMSSASIRVEGNLSLKEKQDIAWTHGFFFGSPHDIEKQKLELAVLDKIFDPIYLGI